MEPLHVVGAGGIGCAVAAALREAGAAVTLVDADPVKVAWARMHGLRVDRRPPQPIDCTTFTDWTPPAHGLVILCTKCYDNDTVLARLPASVILLPIQNGFDPALERRFSGLEGIASFVSECHPHQTHTRITRRGRLHLGARGNGSGAIGHPTVLAELIRLLSATPLFRLTPVPDILPYKYTKLMYNAAISPLAAAAGLDNGQLLSVPRARRLFFALLAENHGILHGARVPLGKIGPFHPTTVAHILRRTWIAHSLAWAFYPTLRKTYCSMSGDLPAGRTEIDYYNRHLIELAGSAPCPLNRRIYGLVKRMERGRETPRLEVLEELLTAAPSIE
jgi:2-dehydropantoate 2-reductase